MYTRVIGLCVCLAPISIGLLACGDDDDFIPPSERPCTPGEQSRPTNDKTTDVCPQNDLASMCMPFPQFVAVTECCMTDGTPGCPKKGFWRRSCQCMAMGGQPPIMGGGGSGGTGASIPKCGDGMVQAGAPYNEKCDPGNAAMQRAAIVMATCGSMGMGSGMLMCDQNCQYDTSMCSGPNGGGGAGGN